MRLVSDESVGRPAKLSRRRVGQRKGRTGVVRRGITCCRPENHECSPLVFASSPPMANTRGLFSGWRSSRAGNYTLTRIRQQSVYSFRIPHHLSRKPPIRYPLTIAPNLLPDLHAGRLRFKLVSNSLLLERHTPCVLPNLGVAAAINEVNHPSPSHVVT